MMQINDHLNFYLTYNQNFAASKAYEKLAQDNNDDD